MDCSSGFGVEGLLTSDHLRAGKKWAQEEKDQIKTRENILSDNGNCAEEKCAD